jgi:superfamily II DNA or RNA helicase
MMVVFFLEQEVKVPYFDNEELRKDLISNTYGAFRRCQRGSLLAFLGHFTSSTESAIFSLPTGAGKTEGK